MRKYLKKSAAIFLALVLLVFAVSGMTAGAEEARQESPDEPLAENIAGEANAPEEVPVRPVITNFTATQMNETQFEIEFDSDIAVTVDFELDLLKNLGIDGYGGMKKTLPVEVTAGHNKIALDLVMEERTVQVISYISRGEGDLPGGEFDVWVEFISYTEGDFRYYKINGNAIVAEYTGAGGNVVFPDKLGGNPVSQVLSVVFDRMPTPEDIASITVPAGVERIDGLTFMPCVALENITFLGQTEFSNMNIFYYELGNLLIRALEGSPAQAYALEFGYTFEALPAPPTDPSSDPVSAPSSDLVSTTSSDPVSAPNSTPSTPATGKTNNPKTADMSAPIVWFAALILAAGAISALSVTRKRVSGK